MADDLQNIELDNAIEPSEGIISKMNLRNVHPFTKISAKEVLGSRSEVQRDIFTSWYPKMIIEVEHENIDDAIIKKALQDIKNVIAQARQFNMAYQA